MQTITTRFQEVKLTGRKTVNCPKCNKKLKRQRTFWQTLNPFNKNKDGEIKNSDNIYHELQAEIIKWQKAPELCSDCEE